MTWVAAIGLLATQVVVAAEPAEYTLVMTIAGDMIELTVPVSALSLRLPQGDLAPVAESRSGAQASPRYFHLADTDRGLVVSGWFESAKSFKGFEAFWVSEFSAMQKAGLVPTAAPTSVAVENWSGAAYELQIPNGVNTHIRAELIQAGTWVDLHISLTSEKPLADARSEALEFLKSIVVKERD